MQLLKLHKSVYYFLSLLLSRSSFRVEHADKSCHSTNLIANYTILLCLFYHDRASCSLYLCLSHLVLLRLQAYQAFLVAKSSLQIRKSLVINGILPYPTSVLLLQDYLFASCVYIHVYLSLSLQSVHIKLTCRATCPLAHDSSCLQCFSRFIVSDLAVL